MKLNTTFLSLLLTGQLLLAAGLYWQAQRSTAPPPATALLSATQTLERMVISDGVDTVEIARSDGMWQLPGLSNLPADGARIERLLQQLASIDTRWPVTTTSGSHARFQVAPDHYQRRIELFGAGESAAHFYLGTSPAFRQVHMRREGAEPVFAVALNTADFPAQAQDWLDRQLLAAAQPQLVEAPDYRLLRDDTRGWRLERPGAAAGAPSPAVDEARAGQLAAALENLRVQGVADAAAVPPDDGAAAPHALTVETSGGERHSYRFLLDEGVHLVQRDDYPVTFTLSEFDYQRIVGTTFDELLLPPQEEPGEDGGA